MLKTIKVEPKPACPDCGAVMVLRRPNKTSQTWDEFWGCPHYPKCQGARSIDFETGLPIDDDDLDGWGSDGAEDE
jgi:ssDNA-binding Zn-finger/Zn-ribbon topoisomerase 1